MPTMPKTFRAPWQGTAEEAAREADQRRGSARERGYTTQWDKASKGFLAKHPLCLACLAAGITALSEVTDHVEPHKGDRARFWNRDNWQPCCRWHHDVVKSRLETLRQAGQIGPAELWLTSAYALGLAAALRVDVKPAPASRGAEA